MKLVSRKERLERASEVLTNMYNGCMGVINDARILESIKEMKSSDDYNEEQAGFVLRNKEIFRDKFSPIYPNGTINHEFFKGFKIKNFKAKKPEFQNKFMSHVGLYIDSNPNSKNFNKLCFAIKEDIKNEEDEVKDKGKHVTSWWIGKLKEDGTFTLNKNLVFEYEELNQIYNNTDFSKLYVHADEQDIEIIDSEEE